MESVPRKLVILFADVAGSTKLYETLGDAEALATIGRCLDIMKAVCDDHGGRVVKTIGDETMAVFPLPANAAYAAIAMQTQISALRTSKGAPLAIHAGFHFGPVIDDSTDVFGDAVNVAARLTSWPRPGRRSSPRKPWRCFHRRCAPGRATRTPTRCAASRTTSTRSN